MTTNEDRVQPNETTVPLLPCPAPEETVAFWRALGFTVAYEQLKPYVYLAFTWSGFQLHYGPAPRDLDPAKETSGGCLVMVDAVAPYHAAFTEAMRRSYGKVLVKGLPRITRYRAGTSRFSVVDPSGNTITFIQRGEPEEVEYGGSKKLQGLARVLDNARILREFKSDDRAAYRALDSGMRRRAEDAPVVEQATALAGLIELAVALEKAERVPEWGALLQALSLTAQERAQVEQYVADPTVLKPWLPDAT
ncbi:glyoxalase [Micromonospora parathelypteridis]|uniref:Catechol 2,3-dioxygenase-like lactoylglutathione lyase family enzyme n=1 Tax=Micromonospora parathelypteridis TaxID=1839617 RepID=A0A840VXT7_9ACTN|nr:glyoxalase [Micromonospora parathelypteridis]MBB5475841.1 catechol 2,3-dioxygenase-like lactoylglutathione lyase family enzyme [Micromonospora parathelypteridis]